MVEGRPICLVLLFVICLNQPGVYGQEKFSQDAYIYEIDVVTKATAKEVSEDKDDKKTLKTKRFISCVNSSDHISNHASFDKITNAAGQEFTTYGHERVYYDGYTTVEIAIDDYAEALNACKVKGYIYAQPNSDDSYSRFEIRTNNKDGSTSARYEIMPGVQTFPAARTTSASALATYKRLTKRPAAICKEPTRRRRARRAVTKKSKQAAPKYTLFCSNCNKSMEKTAKIRMALNCDFHSIVCPCAQSKCRGMSRIKTPVCNVTRYYAVKTTDKWSKQCRRLGCKYLQADTGDRRWYVVASQKDILPGQYRIGNQKVADVQKTSSRAQFCEQFAKPKDDAVVKKVSKASKYSRTTRSKANVPKSHLRKTIAGTRLKVTKRSTKRISTRQNGKEKRTNPQRTTKSTHEENAPNDEEAKDHKKTEASLLDQVKVVENYTENESTVISPNKQKSPDKGHALPLWTKKPVRNAKTTMQRKLRDYVKTKTTSKQRPTNATTKSTTTSNKKRVRCTGNGTRCDDPEPTDPPNGYLYGENELHRFGCNLCAYCPVAPFPYDGKIKKPLCSTDRLPCTCPDCSKKTIDIDFCGMKELSIPSLNMNYRCGIYDCKGVMMVDAGILKLIMIGGRTAVVGGLKNAVGKDISIPVGVTESAVCDLIGEKSGQYKLSESMKGNVICTSCDKNDTKAIRLYSMRSMNCTKLIFARCGCPKNQCEIESVEIQSCVVADSEVPSESTKAECRLLGCQYVQAGLIDSPRDWYVIQRVNGQFEAGLLGLQNPIILPNKSQILTMSADRLNSNYVCRSYGSSVVPSATTQAAAAANTQTVPMQHTLLCSRCERVSSNFHSPDPERSVQCNFAHVVCECKKGAKCDRGKICLPVCIPVYSSPTEADLLRRICKGASESDGCVTPQVRRNVNYYTFVASNKSQYIESGVVRLKNGAVNFVIDRAVSFGEFCTTQGEYTPRLDMDINTCDDSNYNIAIPAHHPKMYTANPVRTVPNTAAPISASPTNAILVCSGCEGQKCEETDPKCSKIELQKDGKPIIKTVVLEKQKTVGINCINHNLTCQCRANSFVDGVCYQFPPDLGDEEGRKKKKAMMGRRAKRELRNPPVLPMPDVPELLQPLCSIAEEDYETLQTEWDALCKSLKCVYPQAQITKDGKNTTLAFLFDTRIMPGVLEAPTGGYRIIEPSPMNTDQFCSALKVDNGEEGGVDDLYTVTDVNGDSEKRRKKQMQRKKKMQK